MYPVDVLRAVSMSQATGANGSLLDAMRAFHKAHGWSGFIRQGAAQEVLRSTTMQSLKFFLFPLFHEGMFAQDERLGSAATRAAAGATCALVEGVFIGPLECAKTGLQLDTTNRFGNSGLRVLRECVRARGPLGAYTGYLGVQWRQSSWTAAFFGSLRFFERRVDEALAFVGLDRSKRKAELAYLAPAHKVASGFSAGAFASLFNCPADVVRTNVQKELLSAIALAEPRRRLSVGEFFAAEAEAHWRIGRGIVAAKGLVGLYTGYAAKASHLGGCGALMALLVPRFRLMLGVE
jgi:solute carrier family 25 2-oxodicarboxylate transporter 21